jgi:hypothetical protein
MVLALQSGLTAQPWQRADETYTGLDWTGLEDILHLLPARKAIRCGTCSKGSP